MYIDHTKWSHKEEILKFEFNENKTEGLIMFVGRIKPVNNQDNFFEMTSDIHELLPEYYINNLKNNPNQVIAIPMNKKIPYHNRESLDYLIDHKGQIIRKTWYWMTYLIHHH